MFVTGADADTEGDSALCRRARAGDTGAFGLLIERHMRRAYRHAAGIVGSREDALDLSQEAFARAFRARHTLDPDRPFYAWLYQILRRLCFNYLRDARTRARILDAMTVDWLVGTGTTSDPAAEAQRAEERRRVAEVIAGLPSHEREVVILKEFDGLKYREIAELLGVPQGTVMSRLYAARKRLGEALESLR